VARLGDPAAFERVREDLLDGQICVHPSSDLLGLEDSQLDDLARETLPNRHCFDVKVCGGDNVDLAACRKAASVLSRLGAWNYSRLRLTLLDHDRIAAGQWDSHREAVDVLLDGVTSNFFFDRRPLESPLGRGPWRLASLCGSLRSPNQGTEGGRALLDAGRCVR
jgi:hypothetical protein